MMWLYKQDGCHGDQAQVALHDPVPIKQQTQQLKTFILSAARPEVICLCRTIHYFSVVAAYISKKKGASQERETNCVDTPIEVIILKHRLGTGTKEETCLRITSECQNKQTWSFWNNANYKPAVTNAVKSLCRERKDGAAKDSFPPQTTPFALDLLFFPRTLQMLP